MLKRGLLFLGLVVIIHAAAVLCMSHMVVMGRPLIFRTGDYYNWPGGDTWARFRAFDRSVEWDAVIIGSSHAYRGYDPAVFAERGYQVYNLGSSAQTPLNSYHIIKQYLDSAHCGLLIFDVYEGTFLNTGLESTADLTQNITSDKAALGMAWGLRDLRGINMIALRWATPYRQPYYESPHPVVQGYVALPDSVARPLPPARDSGLVLLERQKEFFQQCVRLCRERGIRMVVAQHQARKGTHPDRHAAFTAFIDSSLAGTSIPYLDHTFAPGLHDLHHFADNNHLNAAGARIFTGQLVDSLEVLGWLSPR